eukprot:CAMPEP_0194750810 /NCGR_PEP_ID=MMETSP0323_2-20130528/4912_1 /TAXON_ID=2866 ORGANISM="Crypthecodinium cohnii, Strain Seligo" /NCGR_SAMPLE_ID=MMETSP0323_2 /ASSEMBLY_ACC=CAM_ASM_000346 /LENGTH=179 /DNA_ID=CAMNT_0039666889 /DNA_START=67 /DNA_END=605 /DNA_ORIENTATION=-
MTTHEQACLKISERFLATTLQTPLCVNPTTPGWGDAQSAVALVSGIAVSCLCFPTIKLQGVPCRDDDDDDGGDDSMMVVVVVAVFVIKVTMDVRRKGLAKLTATRASARHELDAQPFVMRKHAGTPAKSARPAAAHITANEIETETETGCCCLALSVPPSSCLLVQQSHLAIAHTTHKK